MYKVDDVFIFLLAECHGLHVPDTQKLSSAPYFVHERERVNLHSKSQLSPVTGPAPAPADLVRLRAVRARQRAAAG